MRKVKRARPYEGRSRQEQAQSTRERVIAVARREFLQKGYGATTILGIAQGAGVSVETVYKAFGGKAGLVRAVHQRGLEGRGVTPAETRSEAMSARETDPFTLVDNWGSFVAEVSPLVAPILLLIRSAAATEPELASLLREVDEARRARMKTNAQVLARRGFLSEGVSVQRATDIMWACTSPDLYDLLVVRRGWSPDELGAFVAECLKAVLLRR